MKKKKTKTVPQRTKLKPFWNIDLLQKRVEIALSSQEEMRADSLKSGHAQDRRGKYIEQLTEEPRDCTENNKNNIAKL